MYYGGLVCLKIKVLYSKLIRVEYRSLYSKISMVRVNISSCPINTLLSYLLTPKCQWVTLNAYWSRVYLLIAHWLNHKEVIYTTVIPFKLLPHLIRNQIAKNHLSSRSGVCWWHMHVWMTRNRSSCLVSATRDLKMKTGLGLSLFFTPIILVTGELFCSLDWWLLV